MILVSLKAFISECFITASLSNRIFFLCSSFGCFQPPGIHGRKSHSHRTLYKIWSRDTWPKSYIILIFLRSCFLFQSYFEGPIWFLDPLYLLYFSHHKGLETLRIMITSEFVRKQAFLWTTHDPEFIPSSHQRNTLPVNSSAISCWNSHVLPADVNMSPVSTQPDLWLWEVFVVSWVKEKVRTELNSRQVRRLI